jgi:hypothetical protein
VPPSNLAWDVTPYLDDLNATLPAYHLYQLLCVFFFNRVQIGKVAVLKSMAMLGYGDVMHGHQLVRLIKDIYTYGFTSYVLADRPDSTLAQSDRAFIVQALDGLERTAARTVPEHARAVFLKTLHRLSDRLKRGDTVSPTTMLISLAALLPPSTPQQEPAAFVAAFSEPIPVFSRTTDDSVSGPAETALLARHRDARSAGRDFRPNGYPVPRDSRPYYERGDPRPGSERRDPRPDYERRDPRPDDEHREPRPAFDRRDPRPDSGRAPETPPEPPSLTEMQATIAALQSQVAAHTRRARIAATAAETSRPAAAAHRASALLAAAPECEPHYAYGAQVLDQGPYEIEGHLFGSLPPPRQELHSDDSD